MEKCIIADEICLCDYSLLESLKTYAEDNDLEIVSFDSDLGAFDENGNHYTEMINYLKKNKEICNILFDSMFFLIGSYTDYLNLTNFDNLKIHFIQEGIILNTIKNKDDLVKIMTENFVRNLAQRISLNIEYYAVHGEIPFKPPYGITCQRI